MIVFTPSPEFVDLVINHPSVRPTVERGDHRLYSHDIVTDLKNVVVAFEQGVALFRNRGEEYDGHIFILEGSRGATALAFGRAALERLAKRGCGTRLYTGVPVGLPAARAYCRRLGLKSEGIDSLQEYFSTEIQQWAA